MSRRKVRQRIGGALLAFGLLIGGIATAVAAPVPASAAGFGTGAVSIKGPQSELIPGVTVEIRKGDCYGIPVWHTTTGSSAQAYGAFGIGLEPGSYCIVTLNAPLPYTTTLPVTFTMEPRSANWVTVWLPVSNTVTGAVVAKDANGHGIDGVTAFIQIGECGTSGQGVWRNTTATSRWAVGGFGFALGLGAHCVTVESAPAGFALPSPLTVDVTHPSPMWITLWMPSQSLA